MAQTKQDKAITAANTLISLCAQFVTLRAQFTDFIKAYNSEAYSTTWAAFATAAQSTDGSLGAVDGAPNVAHPIDTRVYTNLQKAVTQTMLVAGVTMLNQQANFFANLAVAQGNYSQNIDDLAN